MADDIDNKSLVNRILDLTASKETYTRSNFKTTSIAGYPLYITWGGWGGIVTNDNSVPKALLLTPYVANGQVALVDVFGQSSIESPLKIIAANVVNPINLKIGITPSLNLSNLVVNEYYAFLVALKPAAFIQKGNALGYIDGYILSADENPEIISKELFTPFKQAKNIWDKLKAQSGINNFQQNGLPQFASPPPPPPPSSFTADSGNK